MQDIVIGLLLILSILLPRLGSRLSAPAWPGARDRLADGRRWRLVVLLFGLFFFWSRALILSPVATSAGVAAYAPCTIQRRKPIARPCIRVHPLRARKVRLVRHLHRHIELIPEEEISYA